MDKLPFGFDTPEESPGFLLWQTTMLWQRQIRRALDPYQISHAQFVIMATLLWFETTTQVAIVNWTKLDKMTVSKSLKKLVTSGHVNRMEHESDTRAKNVSLTQKGKTLIHKLVPIVEGVDSSFFERLRKPDLKHVLHTFKKLTEENDAST